MQLRAKIDAPLAKCEGETVGEIWTFAVLVKTQTNDTETAKMI
jgi:hypothetical protein